MASKDDNTILFDRNDERDALKPPSRCSCDIPKDLLQKVGSKILSPNTKNFSDFVDDDFLNCGIIRKNEISFEFNPVCKMTFLLDKIIVWAVEDSNDKMIELFIKHRIQIDKLVPHIISLCAEKRCYTILKLLVTHKFDISPNFDKCINTLVLNNKVELLVEILEVYGDMDLADLHTSPNSKAIDIAMIILRSAVCLEQVDIFELFFPMWAYDSLPELVDVYIIQAVNFDSPAIVKHIVNNGYDIQHHNYKIVKHALELYKYDLVKYFYETDPNIESILNFDDKIRAGIAVRETKNQNIGVENICIISQENIVIGDYYYQCSNDGIKHYYSREAWEKWADKTRSWICVYCKKVLDPHIYYNQ